MLLVSLLVLAAAPAQPQEAKRLSSREIKKLVDRYVAAAPVDRPAVLALLRPVDVIKRSSLRSWIKRIYGGLLRRGARAVGDDPHTLALDGFPMKYTVMGNPETGDAVAIYMHGVTILVFHETINQTDF